MTPAHRACLLVGVLALVAAACGGSDDTTGDGPATSDPVTLTLLTHDSFAVSDAVLATFTTATGIDVELLQGGDAGTVVNQAILTKGAPQADVLFGIDSTFLSRALAEDVFVPYEAAGLASVPEELLLDPQRRVTPIDYGDVCLNYDKAYFEGTGLPVPTSLQDLADPRYADLLVVQDPATSSPGLAFLLATIAEFGEEGWAAYWQSLVDNGVEVVSGWEEAYYSSFSGGGTSTGDRPLVVSYASSPPAEVVFADPPVSEAPTGVIEASCYRQIEGAGILAGTDHEAEAGELIDFLLSIPFQEDVPLSMFVFPVNPAAELPEVFVAEAAQPVEVYELPASEIDEHREEWIDEWTDLVVR